MVAVHSTLCECGINSPSPLPLFSPPPPLRALQNTHLYGRHLILQWAKEDEDVTELREKTKRKFDKGEQDDAEVIAELKRQKPLEL